MREIINWRQLYMESQAIQPEDTSVSIQRIARLVNIYKNDMLEQDLHQYTQRLTRIARCCPTCAASSYTTIRWLDTLIAGETNLLELRLAGRSVTAFGYYWHKTLLDQRDVRGQLSDFQHVSGSMRFVNHDACVLSTMDEKVIIKKTWCRSILPAFVQRWMTRFRMYYTYRKTRSLCRSIEVHSQPMKTFRTLLQTNIAPIFVCFVHEESSFRQLFWMFRHLITVCNWPSTTKIFTNRAFPIDSVFERMMIKHCGLVDVSQLDLHRTDLLRYLYRCVKTCAQNGPMVFLFDYSTVLQPHSADACLMAFLGDLIRFDLTIPEALVIPTRLCGTSLSFSQPFHFKETIEFFAAKMNINRPLCELLETEERHLVHRFARCLFLHLAYDAAQLEVVSIDIQQPPSVEEPKLISAIRKEYFLEIVTALCIISKVQHFGGQSRVLELDMARQMALLLMTFVNEKNLSVRPCQTLAQIVQKGIQCCQARNYIATDYAPQKSMRYRETIWSDHEWSDDDDDDDDLIGESFADQDDDGDEITMDDASIEFSHASRAAYRINFDENRDELKFFARLFGPHLEALVHALDYHLARQMTTFVPVALQPSDLFHFGETCSLDPNDVQSQLCRSYACQTIDHATLSDEIPILCEPDDQQLYPLAADKLVLLREQFVQLFECCRSLE